MKKSIKKTIIAILFITIFVNLFNSYSNSIYLKNIDDKILIKIASNPPDGTSTGGSYDSRMRDLLGTSWKDSTDASQKVTNVLTTIIVAVKIIAVAIAIIMLLVVAIKYMTSAPGDKAEIKKHAVVYIVGAVILFAVTGILSIIQEFATVLDSPSTQQ